MATPFVTVSDHAARNQELATELSRLRVVLHQAYELISAGYLGLRSREMSDDDALDLLAQGITVLEKHQRSRAQ